MGTLKVWYTDFPDFPGLAKRLELLVINKEIEIVEIKSTHYVVRGKSHPLNIIYTA